MSPLRLALGLLLVSSTIAGCLSPGAGDVDAASVAASLPQEWYHAALAHDEGHNHSALDEHLDVSTPNFRVLGHDPLLTDAYGGEPAFGYGCGDIGTTDEGRRISLVNGFMNSMVFALVDVTDPTHPTKVGEFYSEGMTSWDAATTPDARYALIAFTGKPRVPGEAFEAPAIRFRTACSEGSIDLPLSAMPDAAVVNGVVVVDISTPETPTYVDWDPMPGRNMHSVSSALIDGDLWIMGSSLGGPTTLGLAPLPPLPVGVLQHQLSYVGFDQLVDTPLGPKLTRVSTFQMPLVVPTEGAPVVPFRNGHIDVVMQRHPIDGNLYAYMADWEAGVITIDMSEPRLPKPAGMWMPPHGAMPLPGGDGPCYLTAIHDVLPAPEAWEGKHYYFAGQECPTKVDEHKPGGSVWIVDNTDPANPVTVGDWHLPEDTGVWTVVYQASPHYIALHDRTLFTSNYHAGLWAVDLSDASKLASPPSIGVYLPHLPPAIPPPEGTISPSDEQVDVFPDGTIVLIENSSGVYTLSFDASDPAPPAPPYAYEE